MFLLLTLKSMAIKTATKIAGRPHGLVLICASSSTVTTHTERIVTPTIHKLSNRVHVSGRATVTTHAVFSATASQAVEGTSLSGSKIPVSYIRRGAPIKNTQRMTTGTNVVALCQPLADVCPAEVFIVSAIFWDASGLTNNIG